MGRKTFLLLSFLIAPFCLFGQIDEIGGGIGGLNYTGDLIRGYSFKNIRPAATFFVRSNPKDYLSIRYAITGGLLNGQEEPIDPYAAVRNESFNVTLVEISANVEYYFLDFKSVNSKLRWSPYFVAGLALFTFSGHENPSATYSSFQPSIPLGIGFKYIINPKWFIELEFNTRFTFFDYLDNVSEAKNSAKFPEDLGYVPYGNKNDFDRYYYLGISLSYAFYKIPCPFVYY